ncbi:MAG: hypothetical protein N3E37_04475 [Candidatus Micrarchaeota archaeon]|nr:hypothetical protein [Candidatus Micrarchaeota archaeon]
MVHIGIKSFSFSDFEKNFGEMAKAFVNLPLIIVVRDHQNADKYREKISSVNYKGKVYFFTANDLTRFFDSELGIYYDDYIGYSRGTLNNFLILASHFLSEEEDLIVFSSQVNLLPKIGFRYSEALKSNPLVIGTILGQINNPLLAAVKFFEALQKKDFEAAKAIMRGNWNFRKKSEVNTSLNSDNFGLQGKYKVSCHFSDNDYFSDHFYEFSFQLVNKIKLNILDSERAPEVFLEGIPVSDDYLFVQLVNYLKNSVVEHFFFFNTLKAYPIIVDNKFSLLAVDKFDLEYAIDKVVKESAIQKFKAIADNILKEEKSLDEGLENQLKNFLWFDKKDITPKNDELIVSWTAYQEHGYKFSEIIKRSSGKIAELKKSFEKTFLANH